MRRPQKGELPIRKPRGYPENPDFYKISSIAPLPAVSPSSLSCSDTPKGTVQSVPSDARTVSEGSDELAVISERSQRTKRTPLNPINKLQKRKNDETEAAAALFFGEVASVGSWVDDTDEWDNRGISPVHEHSKSMLGSTDADTPASLSGIPRELKIPHNGHSVQEQVLVARHPEDEVLSKADLAYLAQQNRLLLKQARMIAGVKQEA